MNKDYYGKSIDNISEDNKEELMNIAMFAFEYPPFIHGGLGNYCRKIVEYLHKRNNNLVVFGYNPGDLPEVEKNNDNLTVIRPVFIKNKSSINKRSNKVFRLTIINRILEFFSLCTYNILSFIKLIQINKETKFDIIVIHDWMSIFAGILAIHFLRIPIIFHIHNNYTSIVRNRKKTIFIRIVKRMEFYVSKKAELIIVPTKKMQSILVQNGWDINKIHIIAHGTDLEVVQKAATPEVEAKLKQLENSMNFPFNTKKILYVGRLVPEKGILNLIKALPFVIEKHKDIKLLVLGSANDPKFKEEISLFINKHSLQEYIHIYYRFLNMEDVICHYLYSDICIFPSLYEPFGLVALEAMALKKPVILGDGFCQDTFTDRDNESALFVTSRPECISNAILHLIENPLFATKMAENAYSYVLPRFSWEKTADNTLLAYKNILKRKTCIN